MTPWPLGAFCNFIFLITKTNSCVGKIDIEKVQSIELQIEYQLFSNDFPSNQTSATRCKIQNAFFKILCIATPFQGERFTSSRWNSNNMYSDFKKLFLLEAILFKNNSGDFCWERLFQKQVRGVLAAVTFLKKQGSPHGSRSRASNQQLMRSPNGSPDGSPDGNPYGSPNESHQGL